MSDLLTGYAVDIVRTLRAHGFSAYIVGGAVRDMVLDIEPEDYDIVTDAGTDDVNRLFDRVYPIGEKFGVNLVMMGGMPFEVARFRSESDYRDGRRPDIVQPSNAEEDVRRRDFTMNALLYDPMSKQVIDRVGGLEDIRKGILRTVGDPDRRFREDHLRMLRAVRFAARFGFTIEAGAFDAIRCNASLIVQVSSERAGEELKKMITGPHPARALELLDETNLLHEILPEVDAMKGTEQPADFHPEGDVFEHTRRMFELLGGGASISLALGVLLHDVGKPVTMTTDDRIGFNRHEEAGAILTRNILARLRFPRSTIDQVVMLVKNHMRFIHMREMRESTRRRFMAMDGFGELLELFRLDCLGSHGDLGIWEYASAEYQKFLDEAPSGELPRPLVTGNDLVAAGYDPGPRMGEILRLLHDAQLEGEIATREEALEFAARLFPPDRPSRSPERRKNRPDRPESHDDTPNT